jgi:UDP-N-acetylglucosamine acyltransferase
MPTHIHPTALIDPAAMLPSDVFIGPFAVVEGPVTLGPGCRVEAHAQLVGPITAGGGNVFGRGCVIGGAPQHLSADGAGSEIFIGEGNTFRENVTVNRGTARDKHTQIGDGNYMMAGCHVAHDCLVGNKCIFANNALLAGHVVVGDSVFISGNSAVHQHVRIGRLALLSGVSATTQDLPPFTIYQNINQVFGINVVGMRRAGMSSDEIAAVRQAYRMIYMHNDLIPIALDRCERELAGSEAVAELIAFIRGSKRGIAVDACRPDRRMAA